MSDLLYDLVEYLRVSGLVQGDGIDAFRDFTPDMPDNVVVLREYAGNPGLVDVRSVQVVVRNVDAESAKDKAWRILSVLDVPEDRILPLPGTRWGVVAARQTPFKMGVDERNRYLWGFNLAVTTSRD